MTTHLTRRYGTHGNRPHPLFLGKISEAHETIEDWRIDYNRERPHSSLKYLAPEDFAAALPFNKTQWAPPPELPDGSAPTPTANAAE